MKGHGSKLRYKQEEAIAALLTHSTIEDAARAVGICSKTLSRWLCTPEFKAAYPKAKRLGYHQSCTRLQQGSGAAATTLLKIMLDPNAGYASRIRAAAFVLEHGARSIEVEDLEARVTELERVADTLKSKDGSDN